MGLAAILYVQPDPQLIEALDQRWGGKTPRHDLRYSVAREWYVPATQWRQHWDRHPTSYHGYHGLDIRYWRYPQVNREFITLWCESHGDEEHARLTFEDMNGLLQEVADSSFTVIREELRDQEKR